MGSVHPLGSSHATTTTVSHHVLDSSNSNKTKHPISRAQALAPPNPKTSPKQHPQQKHHQQPLSRSASAEVLTSTSTAPSSFRSAWTTTKERGQAIICRPSTAAKKPPITSISATRTVRNSAATSRASSAPTATIATSTYTASPLTTITTPPTTATPNPATGATLTTAQQQQHTPQSFARRTALRLRDQNVAPPSSPVLKDHRKMGYDSANNTTARPPMPHLSASAARGINRSPLTPKIASTAARTPKTPSAVSAPTHTVTTPLPRRTQAPQATPSTRGQHDDHVAISPAHALASHLSNNITPRSGSRQNRVDSANSTPNGTPTASRTESWDTKSAFSIAGPALEADPAKRPIVTFSPISPDRNLGMSKDLSSAQDPKFFHASDIKASRPTSSSKTAALKSPPTFFYASNNSIPSRPVSPGTLSPALSSTSSFTQSQENLSSKFMYANGTPEVRPTPPPLVSRSSGSVVSTASKVPRTARSAVGLQRPVSPSKPPLQSQTSFRNSANLATAAPRAQVSSPPLGPSPPAHRRPGTATSRSSGHSRSGSLVQGDGPSDAIKPAISIPPTPSLFPPANLSPGKPPPLTLASIIQAAEEFGESEIIDTPPEEVPLGLQSPAKSTHSSSDLITDLVANARKERKIQDLQIRNGSLEAINRTLERQLRKQTAELRRYRRLSRSGRLSLASTTASSRVSSGTFSEIPLSAVGLSDLSEEESDFDATEDESFSDSDSASSNLSPSVIAAREAKRTRQDEDRLAVDLSKHQQILIDSQKINQSIKRCLDWTEELIKDGKKALEYQVRVSDVRLGGRILDPLDEEDDASRLLPSDDTLMVDMKITEEPDTATNWAVEPQDRDSGIELAKEDDKI